MNLEQYVAKKPTQTLVEIQEYTETSTRMISNKTMALLLRGTRTYLLVHEVAQGKRDIDKDGVISNHPAKELCLLIVNSLAGSSTDNNDFNFIIGNSKGDAIIADTEHLRDVALIEYKPQISALLDACISHCNIESKPFESVSQPQLDIAKALVTLRASMPVSVQVTYPSADYITHEKNKAVDVEVNIVEPIPVADNITFICHSANEEPLTDSDGNAILDGHEQPIYQTIYSLNQAIRCTIAIPAGFTGRIDKPINFDRLKAKVRVFATSKFNRNFSARVY